MKNRCAHTYAHMCAKQSDCIKRNIRFYRKIRVTMTTIECYNHTLWTDCCRIANNKTMWKQGKMESILQKKTTQTYTHTEENGVWCWRRRNKLKLNSFASVTLSPYPSHWQCCIIMTYASPFKSMHKHLSVGFMCASNPHKVIKRFGSLLQSSFEYRQTQTWQ